MNKVKYKLQNYFIIICYFFWHVYFIYKVTIIFKKIFILNDYISYFEWSRCYLTTIAQSPWLSVDKKLLSSTCFPDILFMFSFLSGWYCADPLWEHLAEMVRPRMGDISLLLRGVGGKTISRTWVYWGDSPHGGATGK